MANPNMRKGAPSVNPIGRPKGAAGISRYIAEKTNGCAELVDGLLTIARNPETPLRERLGAYQALLDRGLGKSLATTAILNLGSPQNHLPVGFGELPAQTQDRILDEIRERALQGTLTPPADHGDPDHDDEKE